MTQAQPSLLDWAAEAKPLRMPDDAVVGDSSALRERAREVVRRVMDVSLASLLLVATSPILCLAIIAIKLTSRGPMLFSQVRAGRGGSPFTMYKLRTMYVGAVDDRELFTNLDDYQGDPVFKIRHDPRITTVGRILRRSSIDELPQLVNVLRGEMTIVGPRPLPMDEVCSGRWGEWLRLSVKPGLTCLWQIAGRNEIPYSEWMQLDGYYVQNRGLGLDLKIILKTIPAVFSGRGAY